MIFTMIDKTAYIKTVFKESSCVLRISRSRSFGKMLMINTFAAFLKLHEKKTDDLQLVATILQRY